MITGYKIYLDNGAGGAFTEVDAANVSNKPFLNTYDIDMTTKTVGNTYRIFIEAENSVSIVASDLVAVLLASVPDQPSAPTGQSDGTYLRVIMTPPASDGGSQIFSYQLDIKIDEINGWQTVLGGNGIYN